MIYKLNYLLEIVIELEGCQVWEVEARTEGAELYLENQSSLTIRDVTNNVTKNSIPK